MACDSGVTFGAEQATCLTSICRQPFVGLFRKGGRLNLQCLRCTSIELRVFSYSSCWHVSLFPSNFPPGTPTTEGCFNKTTTAARFFKIWRSGTSRRRFVIRRAVYRASLSPIAKINVKVAYLFFLGSTRSSIRDCSFSIVIIGKLGFIAPIRRPKMPKIQKHFPLVRPTLRERSKQHN